MKILAHRGFWREPSEKNTFTAFERAWASGFGIETDLRDLNGTIVVSHDPPCEGVATFESLLKAHTGRGPLALNIKADGLQASVAQSLAKFGVSHFFVFDMSVPDSLSYFNAGMPVFARLSEFEAETPLVARATGIWLDAFEREWWTADTVRELCASRKAVAVVSPELHRRPHMDSWQVLRSLAPDVREQVLLCTDFPADAEKFFGS
jgi:glycerophosphoryl diester phosphodiesterase